MPGRWIVGESGARKIATCASIFYPLCVDRLGVKHSSLQYVPWMASPKLSQAFIENDNFPEWDVTSKIDFGEKNLNSQQFFLALAIKDSHINISTNMRVFEGINSQKGTIEIYRIAYELIEIWPKWQRDLFLTIVKSIVPIWVPHKDKQDGNSFSDPDFLGAIFTSVDPRSPFPDLTLNITFAHELGHLCLMFYQFSGDLFFGNDIEVYSGVRKTTRPVLAAFHAAVALGFMISAANSLLNNTAKEDFYRVVYLNALLSDYRENLTRSLNEIDKVEKSALCSEFMRDLWTLLK